MAQKDLSVPQPNGHAPSGEYPGLDGEALAELRKAIGAWRAGPAAEAE